MSNKIIGVFFFIIQCSEETSVMVSHVTIIHLLFRVLIKN